MRSSDVRIESPCHERWDGMTVAGTRRFCDKCSQHVHDLSALPESEARAVLARAEAGERVCVRYSADARGEIRFRSADVVPTSSLTRIASTRRAAAALAGSGLAVALAACAPHAPEGNKGRRPNVLVDRDSDVVGKLEARPEPEPDPEPFMGAVAIPPTDDEPKPEPPTDEPKPEAKPEPPKDEPSDRNEDVRERPHVKMGMAKPRPRALDRLD